MGVDIQWGLAAPALQANHGEQFQNALMQGITRSATSALAADPNNQRAMNALMQFNPEAGLAMQQRQQQQRTAAANEARLRGEENRQNQENAREVAEARGNLIAMGVSEQQLANFDPSDANLDALIAQGMSAVQQTQMQAAGRMEVDGIVIGPDNRPVYESPYPKIIPGTDGSFYQVPRYGVANMPQPGAPQAAPGPAPQAGTQPVRVNTPEEARQLPPGTMFTTPDGRTLQVPGGPSASSGGFLDPAALSAWRGY
jgi:hypothetical protein